MSRALGLMLMTLTYLYCSNTQAQDKPALVTPSDCVMVKYIVGVWLNSSGTSVAYLVKAPNIQTNHNDYLLYVRDLKDRRQALGQLVLTGEKISDVKWFDNDRQLSLLKEANSHTSLTFVSINTKVQSNPFPVDGDITSYSIDATGTTIAYAITTSRNPSTDAEKMPRDLLESGYRVTTNEGKSETSSFPHRTIYIRHLDAHRRWDSGHVVVLEDPFSHIKMSSIPSATQLSLSPDGTQLLFTYITDHVPNDWKTNPLVAEISSLHSFQGILVRYDTRSEETYLAFKMVFPASVPMWSRDGTSFLVNSPSPVGSTWETEDIRDHRVLALDANLFRVNVLSGSVDEVFRHVPDHHQPPLLWREDGDVVVDGGGNSVRILHQEGGSWREKQRITLPSNPGDQFWFMTSAGASVIAVRQAVTTPPDLVSYDPGSDAVAVLTDLNSQLNLSTFAKVKRVNWTTEGGLSIDGLLFMPSKYVEGTRYPLVIQTKGNQGQFTCDSGQNHDPSFAPQPLATAGIMYLVRTSGDDYNYGLEVESRPKNYPGSIGEAAQEMDIWESAVENLSTKGMVDPSRVGIIGFSRTGWYVEFSLFRSKIRYAAATVADNVQYSLGERWLFPLAAQDDDQLYGGPPYGATLKNWLDYSISFNLDKIHTPLLAEEMGYGIHDDKNGASPIDLSAKRELINGLTLLGKPTELYYYPDDVHQPDNPKARLASLQRNVDWYRFWLQGYERPNPEDPDQYKRWEHLRALHDADQKASVAPAAH